MRINGRWRAGADGVLRPVVEVILSPRLSLDFPFLVDTGADRTVISRPTLDALGLDQLPAETDRLSGLGGQAGVTSLNISMELRLDGGTVRINGPFSASLDSEALDDNLLGRDVMNHFDASVSYRRREVLLLATAHGYQVTS